MEIFQDIAHGFSKDPPKSSLHAVAGTVDKRHASNILY